MHNIKYSSFILPHKYINFNSQLLIRFSAFGLRHLDSLQMVCVPGTHCVMTVKLIHDPTWK